MNNYRSFSREVLEAIGDAEIRALEKIGMLVEAEAKLRTPVDTGTLKRSITNNVEASQKKVSIGTNVEYASMVEKGTSKQRAQPYLTPAAEENKDKIKDIIVQELSDIG